VKHNKSCVVRIYLCVSVCVCVCVWTRATAHMLFFPLPNKD